jgi:thiol-disulfide isomerase/thioredoxin
MRRWLLASVALISFSTIRAEDLPRYSLPVGRTLTYASESKDEMGTQGSRSSQSETKVIVVGENSDGSKRLIVRSSSKVDLGGGRTQEELETLRISVFPDGRLVAEAGGRPGSDRSSMFAILPADEAQLKSQWQSVSPIDGSIWTQRLVSDSPEKFVFATAEEGPINRIYLVKIENKSQFDRAKGVIVQVDTEMSQDYGIHSKGKSTLKLVKDEMMEPAKAEALGKDYEVWYTAHESYLDLMRRLEAEPAQASELGSQGRALLEAAAKNATTEDVKQQFANALKEQDANFSYSLQSAKERADLLGKPAKAWQARDIDGKDWSLADLRGKVVVMDFWYRGCGWCMYAMPQVKQLTIDFKDKPVVFLGLNTDRNDDDAKFVVKEFGLPYAQIKAETIAKDMNVHAFPTMIIVDQLGIVRAFEVGWSPNLREKVTAKLEKLLNSPQ